MLRPLPVARAEKLDTRPFTYLVRGAVKTPSFARLSVVRYRTGGRCKRSGPCHRWQIRTSTAARIARSRERCGTTRRFGTAGEQHGSPALAARQRGRVGRAGIPRLFGYRQERPANADPSLRNQAGLPGPARSMSVYAEFCPRPVQRYMRDSAVSPCPSRLTG